MEARKQCTISCQSCSFSQLCLPFSLTDDDLAALDDIIERKKPLQKNQLMVEAGHPMKALFAVRSGSFKTYTLNSEGQEQVTGFHLPGDIIGFDSLGSSTYQSYAVALETAMVCQIPFKTLDSLSAAMPALRQQVMKLMSNEIRADQHMFTLLNKHTAQSRLAAFIKSLSERYGHRGFSPNEFRFSMTRADMSNYLGLSVETVSRILTNLQKANTIRIDGRFIHILDPHQLAMAAS